MNTPRLNNHIFNLMCSALTVVFFLLSVFVPTLDAKAAERVFPHKDNLIIVIDPGHGGTDTGTQGGRIQERFMNLTTAAALSTRLNMYDGVTVYMTRYDNDTFISLTDRAKFAASVNADFVISVHYNACETHDRFGIETYTSRIPPYNAYGYQLGNLLNQKYEEKYGIFPRGVKTRKGLRTDGDYYTIISANIYRSIPAIIVEHCYADGTVDKVHTENDDLFTSYGITDADAIAEFFGLSSGSLGIDNSGYNEALVNADVNAFNIQTYEDRSAPDDVKLSVINIEPSENYVELKVEATENDGMMMYYEFSLDGGWTWSEPEVWPGANTYQNSYDSSFTLKFRFNDGDRPAILVKGFNRYDGYTKSNMITFIDKFDSKNVPIYRSIAEYVYPQF